MRRIFCFSRILNTAAFSILCLLCLFDTSFASQQLYKSNVMTASHVKVQGTHVALIPPAGAAKAVSFRGFEIESRGVTLEIVESRQSYESVMKTLSDEKTKAGGVKISDTAKVVLNENPATLMMGTRTVKGPEGEGEEEIGLVLFVFGSDKISVSMYGYYPLSDRSAATALRTSMLSVVFDDGQSENSGGDYTLSASGTSFKFKGEVNYVRRYEPDSKNTAVVADGEEAASDAYYSSTMLNKTVEQADRAKYADELLASYMSSFEEYTVASSNSITIAGLQGIETIADFVGATRRSRTASGGIVRRPLPGKAYQVVLFDNKSGRIFVLQGLSVRDSEVYLPEFKRITSTFKLTK